MSKIWFEKDIGRFYNGVKELEKPGILLTILVGLEGDYCLQQMTIQQLDYYLVLKSQLD